MTRSSRGHRRSVLWRRVKLLRRDRGQSFGAGSLFGGGENQSLSRPRHADVEEPGVAPKRCYRCQPSAGTPSPSSGLCSFGMTHPEFHQSCTPGSIPPHLRCSPDLRCPSTPAATSQPSARKACHFRWEMPLCLPMNAIVSIDEAGRLVLPKRLRVQFNLHAGSELEVAACPDHLELRPVEATPPLKEVGSLLVHQGSTRVPLANAVRQLRGERAAAQSRGIRS